MFRKIVTVVVVLPLAAIIIAFAVANRQPVTVSFDPLSTTDPAYAATLPLFIMIFVLVIVGVIVGGVASWLRQGQWRRAARKAESENRALHHELAALRRRIAAEAQATAPRHAGTQPAPAALPAIPPSAG
ncbi:MAG: DUF1049 domain-containing protein [Rhodopseudomonas sp.]|nr:DUF1049 domain-containing protein [Rhodopseudomonas sp.]